MYFPAERPAASHGGLRSVGFVRCDNANSAKMSKPSSL